MNKEYFRRSFPKIYDALWHLKKAVTPRRWGKYYAPANHPWLFEPIPELWNVSLSPHIDTILDIGCASGRNFIPFDGKLKLWGIDIVPEKDIAWIRPFKNLTYQQLTVEEFTKILEEKPLDLSRTFVFESVTLMYVSKRNQERFFLACLKRGCTNFMFREFRPDSLAYPKTHLKLDENFFIRTPDSSDPINVGIYTRIPN